MTVTTQTGTATAAPATVQAGINERKFFETMKHLFSSNTTFLGELLQNARRAGATRVDITYDPRRAEMTVRDDGCGVADFAALVQVCESDWSEATTLHDRPFGMGLFSVFHAAQQVRVKSNGKMLAIRVEDVVARRSLPITQEANTPVPHGTELHIQGLDEALQKPEMNHYKLAVSRPAELCTNKGWPTVLMASLLRFATGFPIPIYVNGHELPRPHAQDRLPMRAFACGALYMRYFEEMNAAWNTRRGHSLAMYLQGLPIGHGDDWRGDADVVVHLDSTQFVARMPDRAMLYDHHAQEAIIQTAITHAVHERLRDVKQAMAPAHFVARHAEACQASGANALLRDLPYIPINWLQGISGPSVNYEEVTCEPLVEDKIPTPWGPVVPREAIRSGKVRIWRNMPATMEESDVDTVLLTMAASLNAHRVQQPDPEHWIESDTPDATCLTFSVVPEEPSGEASVYIGEAQIALRLAKSVTVRMHTPGESEPEVVQTFTGEVFVSSLPGPAVQSTHRQVTSQLEVLDPQMTEECRCNHDMVAYITETGSGAGSVSLFSSFRDENESYREDWEAEARRDWKAAVNKLRNAGLGPQLQLALQEAEVPIAAHQRYGMVLVTAEPLEGREGVCTWRTQDLHERDFWQRVAQRLQGRELTDVSLLRAFSDVAGPGLSRSPSQPATDGA